MFYRINAVVFYMLSLLCILSVSCTNTKKAVYFADQADAVLPASAPIPEITIRNNDLLSISVSSLNPGASAIFNTPNVPLPNQGSNSPSSGYLVNSKGNIQFPVLGDIKAAGLTTNQLREQIVKSLTEKKLLVDPIVSVRQLNFRVSVLGEVAKPTVINVPDEKISLLEALGLAGDLTIYGKRENVMVIREENGQKIIKRLNLNSSELFNSPYYYLKSNDIVYVEPNRAKVASSTRTNQLLPIILSGLSFAAIIVDRLTR